MLIIDGEEFLDKKKLKIVKKKTKKTQILLFDTKRKFVDYVSKLKYRMNGEYEDIPHFIISKNGFIYQIFGTDYYSNTFNEKNIDKRQIKIGLENLGWLNKNAINGILSNWIGDVYRAEPYIKSWKSYFFWDPYTELQVRNLSILLNELCEKYNINKTILHSNDHLINKEDYIGILSKSNYDDIYTDINPSFNYKLIFENDTKNKE